MESFFFFSRYEEKWPRSKNKHLPYGLRLPPSYSIGCVLNVCSYSLSIVIVISCVRSISASVWNGMDIRHIQLMTNQENSPWAGSQKDKNGWLIDRVSMNGYMFIWWAYIYAFSISNFLTYCRPVWRIYLFIIQYTIYS